MNAGEKLRLLANLDPLWAEETLRDRGGELTADSVYALKLAATGNVVEAAQARADAHERQRRAAHTRGEI